MSISNQQSKGSNPNPSGKNTSKNSIRNHYIIFFFFVTLFIVFVILIITLSEKYDSHEEYVPVKERYEEMDTIVTASDDTIKFPYRKKGRAKGPYRGSNEYEVAYEEGYEDGLADKRFE